MSDWFMKSPCKHCPFRRDVPPFLHPDRADEISSLAWNPYNDFPCHKTIDYNTDEYDADGEEYADTRESLMCAGFLTMQITEHDRKCPDGFEPSANVYGDSYEMVDAYSEAWERRRK